MCTAAFQQAFAQDVMGFAPTGDRFRQAMLVGGGGVDPEVRDYDEVPDNTTGGVDPEVRDYDEVPPKPKPPGPEAADRVRINKYEPPNTEEPPRIIDPREIDIRDRDESPPTPPKAIDPTGYSTGVPPRGPRPVPNNDPKPKYPPSILEPGPGVIDVPDGPDGNPTWGGPATGSGPRITPPKPYGGPGTPGPAGPEAPGPNYGGPATPGPGPWGPPGPVWAGPATGTPRGPAAPGLGPKSPTRVGPVTPGPAGPKAPGPEGGRGPSETPDGPNTGWWAGPAAPWAGPRPDGPTTGGRPPVLIPGRGPKEASGVTGPTTGGRPPVLIPGRGPKATSGASFSDQVGDAKLAEVDADTGFSGTQVSGEATTSRRTPKKPSKVKIKTKPKTKTAPAPVGDPSSVSGGEATKIPKTTTPPRSKPKGVKVGPTSIRGTRTQRPTVRKKPTSGSRRPTSISRGARLAIR